MNTKTFLTIWIPSLISSWRKYKKGLKAINKSEWCIACDYVDDKNKPNCVISFTIFPKSVLKTLIVSVQESIPTDIKHKSNVNDKTLNLIKKIPYCFTFSIILKNKKNLCNNKFKENINHLTDGVQKLKGLNLNTYKEKLRKLREIQQYLRQGNCSKEKIGLLIFVSKFLAYICEFLLIKENTKQISIISDRDAITEMFHNILYDFTQSYTEKLLRNRVKEFYLNIPIPSKRYQHESDAITRIPDFFSGTLSSLHPKGNDIAYEKQKHRDIFINWIMSNNKLMLLEIDIQENGLFVTKNTFFIKPDDTKTGKNFLFDYNV